MNRFKAILTLLLVATIRQNAWACAVCFGDPNSPMSHGARAGVLFLLGVVVVVLSGILGMTLFWAKRARAIAQGSVPASEKGSAPRRSLATPFPERPVTEP